MRGVSEGRDSKQESRWHRAMSWDLQAGISAKLDTSKFRAPEIFYIQSNSFTASKESNDSLPRLLKRAGLHFIASATQTFWRDREHLPRLLPPPPSHRHFRFPISHRNL